MSFHPLVRTEELHEGFRLVVELNELRLLLLQVDGETYLVENRCGHFGVPIDAGEISQGCITCPVHGMRFRLRDGAVDNRPWEGCDPLRVFVLIEREGELGVELP
ncbi:MAG: Rieske (2Fe-2S) protein [Chromatiales bacterium]|nr:Rieske (2Fe-2S) protein [Chromatiales bacterium]